MDPASIFTPGAQALVTQILADGWTQAREWLARRLSGGGPAQAELEQRLEAANAQTVALAVPETGVTTATAQRMVLEAYWTGYLAALAGEHPGFAAAITDLAGNKAATTTISMTGTATNFVQADRIEGGVHFG